MADSEPLPAPEAQDRILHDLAPLPEVWASLEEALGAGLTSEVKARRTLPPWDNSAMDGYAVRSADAVRVPVTLRVVEMVHAGDQPDPRRPPRRGGRIMTGAPMPPGADAVVMQERTRALPGEGLGAVEILEPVALRAERARRRRGRARRRAAPPGRHGARHPRAGAARRTGNDLGTRSATAAGGHRLHRRRAVPPGRGAGRTHRRHQLGRAGARGEARRRRPASCWASRVTARGGRALLAQALGLRRRAHHRRRLRGRARPRPASARAPGRGDGLLARGDQARQAAGLRSAGRDPGLRAARQPDLVAGDLRALRPACAAAPGRSPARRSPSPCGPKRRGPQEEQGVGSLRPGGPVLAGRRALGRPAYLRRRRARCARRSRPPTSFIFQWNR